MSGVSILSNNGGLEPDFIRLREAADAGLHMKFPTVEYRNYYLIFNSRRGEAVARSISGINQSREFPLGPPDALGRHKIRFRWLARASIRAHSLIVSEAQNQLGWYRARADYYRLADWDLWQELARDQIDRWHKSGRGSSRVDIYGSEIDDLLEDYE